MKKAGFIVFFISALFLLNTCALEIANVIGPGGGYVFYDRGHYEGGWRYIECSSFDFGEVRGVDTDSVKEALEACKRRSGGWYSFPWELPTEAELKKMLECFTYGLTQFKSGVHYLSVNNLYVSIKDHSGFPANPDNLPSYLKDYDIEALPKVPDVDKGSPVILYMDFGGNYFGSVKSIRGADALSFTGDVKIRPIRRF